MGFLPDNYETPQGGNYMRLEQGENRLRVLGPAVVGNEFWTTEDGARKPVRRRIGEAIHDSELGVDQYGKPERVKHFWAMPVWNTRAGQVQILEITQKTIMAAIEGLYRDPEWGDPAEYDIKINKSGSGMETEYRVTPVPKSPISPEVAEAFADAAPDCQALFDGGDPFAGSTGSNKPATKTTADKSDTAHVKIDKVEVVPMPKGGNAYVVHTDKGPFGTTDEELGKTIQSFGKVDAALVYHTTAQNKRIIDDATPAVHTAVDEDDIPF